MLCDVFATMAANDTNVLGDTPACSLDAAAGSTGWRESRSYPDWLAVALGRQLFREKRRQLMHAISPRTALRVSAHLVFLCATLISLVLSAPAPVGAQT